MKKSNHSKQAWRLKKCSKVPLSLALAGAFVSPALQALETKDIDSKEGAKNGAPLVANIEKEPLILMAHLPKAWLQLDTQQGGGQQQTNPQAQINQTKQQLANAQQTLSQAQTQEKQDQAALTQAQAAAAKTAAALQTATTNNTQAQAAVTTAQQTEAAKTAAAKTAAADLQNATQADTEAKAAVQQATQAVTAAQGQVTTATSANTAAQEAEAKAKQAADAKPGDQALQQAYQQAQQKAQEAQDALTKAQQALTTAQQTETAKTTAAQQAATALQSATQADTAAKQAVTAAQQAVAAAQAAAAKTTAALQTATTNNDNAQKAVTAAQGALTKAQAAVTTAQNNVNTLQNKLNSEEGNVAGGNGGNGGGGPFIPIGGGGGPQNPQSKPQQQPQTASQQIQQDLNTLSSATATAADKQQAYQNYLKQEQVVVAQTTASIVQQADTIQQETSQTNAIGGLVNGMNALVEANGIPASVSQAYNTFYNLVAAANTNFYQMQSSLNALIAAVQREQQALLAQLNPANAAVSARLPDGVQGATLVRLWKEKGFGGETPQEIAAQLGNLNTLLAYLTTTKSKLGSYLLDGDQPTAKAPLKAAPQNSYSSENGNMYGVDVQVGYKQFFGKSKRWGLRYYGTFSYQHGTFYMDDRQALDNFVYGAGVDALYNFYESSDAKYTTGLFAGLMFTGSTWLAKGASGYQALMASVNRSGGHALMNTTYFQIPLNIGFRTNVSKHHGFEIGLRIPLATNYYFKGTGANGNSLAITYKRNISVFFNYVYNF
ncbi:outer membrane protein [Helicobacter ailurogastricus]|uniref:outer membrane protein n=1 Tax=Helicobacter ailurogastricus TaxID=1578720 RepID=UPI001F42061C|nr:outer membrane protein [Helicobacter ailurogastricus]